METTIILIIPLVFVSSLAQEGNSTCPPWFIKTDKECECGSSLGGIVSCHDGSDGARRVATKPCYCMTVDEVTNKTVLGACPS